MTLTEMIKALPHGEDCRQLHYKRADSNTKRIVASTGPVNCNCGLSDAIAQARKADAVIEACSGVDWDNLSAVEIHIIETALTDYNGTKETDK